MCNVVRVTIVTCVSLVSANGVYFWFMAPLRLIGPLGEDVVRGPKEHQGSYGTGVKLK